MIEVIQDAVGGCNRYWAELLEVSGDERKR